MTKDFLEELDHELNSGDDESIVDDTTPEENEGEGESYEEEGNDTEDTKETKEKPSKDYKESNGSNGGDNRRPYNGTLRQNLMSNFPQTRFYLPNLRDGYTRVIPVGGHNEVGKNMSMFQYNDEIVLIDSGMQFPDADMLGAKYSVPDISFLIPYKDKIHALIITHGHLDHIGALKHVLPALGMPKVYGTKLTIGLIRKSLEENNLLATSTLVEIDPDSEEQIAMGSFKIEFFRQNHSIPDSTGVYLETPSHKIVHTGDFKFDFTPAIDKPADLSRIAKIGTRGIDILMSDSTNSTKKGFTKSEKEIGEGIKQVIEKHRGSRIIIATFSSLIGRIQQIVEASEENGKYLYLSGRSMVENVRIARELGFIKGAQNTIRKMTSKAVEGVPDNKQVIVTTGSQGEEFSALYRMAEGTHQSIEVKPGDTIVLSSTPIPGNERSVVDVINKLIRLGATVVTNDDLDIHASGHASQEEQKIMLSLIKPKFFMPLHGELFMRVAHKKTAMELGIKSENIILSDNGNILDLTTDEKVFKSKIKVPLEEVIVDGHGIGIAGSHVIKAREKMMNSGVVVIVFKTNEKTKEIIGPLKIETRGLVYLDEVRQIHRLIIKKAKTTYENLVKDVPEVEDKELIKIIKTDLETFLVQKIDREPMIIPVIMSV